MTNSRITLRDLMNSQNRVEDKIDSFRKEINLKFDKMETRVKCIEDWKGNLTGKLAIIGTIALLAVNIAWSLIKDLFKAVK